MRVMNLKLFPSCTQRPRTSSFRIETTTSEEDDIFKTINSMYIEPEGEPVETPESWFTNSSESTPTTTEFDESSIESHLELIIRGAQKSTDQRLFFEPRSETNSIIFKESPKLHTTKNVRNLIPNISDSNLIPNTQWKMQHKALSFPSPPPPQLANVSVMMSLESKDPYEDFKKSMEEIIESVGMRHDLEGLEEMLAWYLKANDEINHGYIVGSFVDLLAEYFANDNDFEICKSSTNSYSYAPSLLSSSTSTSSQLLDYNSDHMLC